MERRGFLKACAALLPAAALTRTVDDSKAETPSPAQELIRQHATLQSGAKVPQMKDVPLDLSCCFCDVVAEQGSVVELVKFEPSMVGNQYAVVRPGRHGGQPLGILLDNVVNADLGRRHLDFHKNEVQVGGKVRIAQGGQLLIGQFDEQVQIGDMLYYNNDGKLTTQHIGHAIGVARTNSDQNGFVNMEVNLFVNKAAMERHLNAQKS